MHLAKCGEPTEGRDGSWGPSLPGVLIGCLLTPSCSLEPQLWAYCTPQPRGLERSPARGGVSVEAHVCQRHVCQGNWCQFLIVHLQDPSSPRASPAHSPRENGIDKNRLLKKDASSSPASTASSGSSTSLKSKEMSLVGDETCLLSPRSLFPGPDDCDVVCNVGACCLKFCLYFRRGESCAVMVLISGWCELFPFSVISFRPPWQGLPGLGVQYVLGTESLLTWLAESSSGLGVAL